jgi:hypothetical protein
MVSDDETFINIYAKPRFITDSNGADPTSKSCWAPAQSEWNMGKDMQLVADTWGSGKLKIGTQATICSLVEHLLGEAAQSMSPSSAWKLLASASGASAAGEGNRWLFEEAKEKLEKKKKKSKKKSTKSKSKKSENADTKEAEPENTAAMPGWTFYSSNVAVTNNGFIATKLSGNCGEFVTCEQPLLAGIHYWEVEVLDGELDDLHIGVIKPDMERKAKEDYYDYAEHCEPFTSFIRADNGCLYGNGMNADYEAGRFECGDKVGILLDLGAGSMQFFKNGSKHGPGFPPNSIDSPVVPALLMYSEGDSVKLLSNALHPAEQKKERAKQLVIWQTKMAKQKQQRGAGAGAGAGSSHSVSVFGFSQLPTGSATKPTAIKPITITPKQKAPKKKPKGKHQPK